MPQAPAALLKAAIICTGIVTLPQASAAAGYPPPAPAQASNVAVGSLEEQLRRVFGTGGVRVTSRSRLPQGSGMGTSSILAGEPAEVSTLPFNSYLILTPPVFHPQEDVLAPSVF